MRTRSPATRGGLVCAGMVPEVRSWTRSARHGQRLWRPLGQQGHVAEGLEDQRTRLRARPASSAVPITGDTVTWLSNLVPARQHERRGGGDIDPDPGPGTAALADLVVEEGGVAGDRYPAPGGGQVRLGRHGVLVVAQAVAEVGQQLDQGHPLADRGWCRSPIRCCRSMRLSIMVRRAVEIPGRVVQVDERSGVGRRRAGGGLLQHAGAEVDPRHPTVPARHLHQVGETRRPGQAPDRVSRVTTRLHTEGLDGDGTVTVSTRGWRASTVRSDAARSDRPAEHRWAACRAPGQTAPANGRHQALGRPPVCVLTLERSRFAAGCCRADGR